MQNVFPVNFESLQPIEQHQILLERLQISCEALQIILFASLCLWDVLVAERAKVSETVGNFPNMEHLLGFVESIETEIKRLDMFRGEVSQKAADLNLLLYQLSLGNFQGDITELRHPLANDILWVSECVTRWSSEFESTVMYRWQELYKVYKAELTRRAELSRSATSQIGDGMAGLEHAMRNFQITPAQGQSAQPEQAQVFGGVPVNALCRFDFNPGACDPDASSLPGHTDPVPQLGFQLRT